MVYFPARRLPFGRDWWFAVQSPIERMQNGVFWVSLEGKAAIRRAADARSRTTVAVRLITLAGCIPANRGFCKDCGASYP